MKRIASGGLVLVGIFGMLTCLRAEDPKKPAIDAKAEQALKKMSTYLSGLKQFTVEGEETFDEVLDNGQKVQFSHQRKIAVSRPGHVVAEFKGDLSDRLFYYNGKTVVMYDKDKKVYGSHDFKGSVDELINMLHEKLGFSVPLSDLLMQDPYKILTKEVTSGTLVGVHNVGGVKCDHLAFTQKLVDWQIWIETGDKPLPRKLVITQKQLRGEPQYTAVLSRWDTTAKLADTMFDFTPPKDVKRIGFLKLPNPDTKEPVKKDK